MPHPLAVNGTLSLTLARSQLPVHRAPDAGYKKGTRALLRTPHHTLPSHSLPRYPPPLCPRQEGGSIAAVASARGGRACHARQLPRSTTTTRPRWPFSFQLSPLSDSPPSQHLTRGRFPCPGCREEPAGAAAVRDRRASPRRQPRRPRAAQLRQSFPSSLRRRPPPLHRPGKP